MHVVKAAASNHTVYACRWKRSKQFVSSESDKDYSIFIRESEKPEKKNPDMIFFSPVQKTWEPIFF